MLSEKRALQRRVRVTGPRERFPRSGQRRGSKGRNRQPHDERRALALPVTARFDAAPVQFDEMLYNRQAEPETAVRACHGGVLLPEGLKDVREEWRRDASSRVGHDSSHTAPELLGDVDVALLEEPS